MTGLGETEEPTGPVWVVSHPGMLSPEAIHQLRRQLVEAIESGKPMVLDDGMTLYDARHGAPVVTTEVEATSTLDLPEWLPALLASTAASAFICAAAAVLIVLNLNGG